MHKSTVMINFFRRIISALTVFLQVLKTNFPVVISIGALYLVFGVADQGQDMLININSTNLGPATLYFTLGVLALMHWQFPKFFSREALSLPRFRNIFTAELYSSTTPLDYYRIVPRLFGVATFLVPAYCILKVIQKYDVVKRDDWYTWIPTIFIFGSILIFGILLRFNLFVKF